MDELGFTSNACLFVADMAASDYSIGLYSTQISFGLLPTGPGGHNPDRTQANHALAVKLDHSSGADHDHIF